MSGCSDFESLIHFAVASAVPIVHVLLVAVSMLFGSNHSGCVSSWIAAPKLVAEVAAAAPAHSKRHLTEHCQTCLLSLQGKSKSMVARGLEWWAFAGLSSFEAPASLLSQTYLL